MNYNNSCPFMNNGDMMPDQMIPGYMMPGRLMPRQANPYMMQSLPQMNQFQNIQPYNNPVNPNGMVNMGINGNTGLLNDMYDTYDMNNMNGMNNMNNMNGMNGMNSMNSMNGMDEMEDPESMDEIDVLEAQAATSDPPPVLSNNPAVPTISLFKELTGYPNYGNPSRNADILYTGNRGVWTFLIPTIISSLGNIRAQLSIRAVLDDHTSVAVSRYSAQISINGNIVHTGRVPLEHGTPSGQQFTNWKLLTFDVSNLRRNNRIVIVNTSTAGANDWIGLDWMEMKFTR